MVIGTGAIGMSFVDTMLDESDATFLMVDRHHMPGGHWNDAYPFVRLHQPSAFYGVASTELGSNRIDQAGANKGMYELASGTEVLAYFDNVMRERFLPSGRVQYFPMCDYLGDGKFASLLSGDEFAVSCKKTVDGTFFNTTVPSTHTRNFEVDEGVECIAPNALPRRAPNFQQFTVLGGGKTAMDAIVWLLEAGASADSIRWVCPRDSWLINRATTQPGGRFFTSTVGAFANQLEAMVAAESVQDLWHRMEACDTMLRVDPNIEPTMFHFATISQGELEQLRRIDDVVRGGHVSRITADALCMKNGEQVPASADTLYVDCTATAVKFTDSTTRVVFQGDQISLQALRAPLVATSAAVIAFVEANFDDEAEKNRLCAPVGLSDDPAQWIATFMANMMNMNIWINSPELRQWLANCRLNPARRMPDDKEGDADVKRSYKDRIAQNTMPAMMNLQKLMAAAR